MVRPWRPKRSRRNAQRAPGRTGPDCVMRGPLLVLGWPELSELGGCLGCRALAEHGLRSCRWTPLGGYARAGALRKAGCLSPRARIGGTFVLDRVLLCKSQRDRAQLRWRVQSARTERRRAGSTGGRAEGGASTWASRCGSLVPRTRRAVSTRSVLQY